MGYAMGVEIGREDANLNFGEQYLGASRLGLILVVASDTGSSSTDNLTKLNNASSPSKLTFLVTGVTAGAEVRIYAGDVLIGTATATGNQVEVITNGTTVLTDGQHQITATVAMSGFESDPSTTVLSITIDAMAPGGVTTTLPEEVRVGQPLSIDLNSPNEGAAGRRLIRLSCDADRHDDRRHYRPADLATLPVNKQSRRRSMSWSATPPATPR